MGRYRRRSPTGYRPRQAPKAIQYTFWPNYARESDGGSVRSNGDETSLEEATRVTRTIMIVKPPGYQTGSPPVSPDGATPPVSPFAEFF
ncbi:hypothetical protein ES332_D11G366700v1 [Gossypium tomentosum]|uniref:Uncharacterized protein n=1 Tax=Gossypium tomentosum TaxID=34277 RepID=A0A5D2IXI1_GOSTO|nr:hypothetical protein ES332_D11G366700v1 [Gossypium tomentosum]TYH46825.1 hypothetical protein ES332_D11G366700v1 [Gossypium tomentosum]